MIEIVYIANVLGIGGHIDESIFRYLPMDSAQYMQIIVMVIRREIKYGHFEVVKTYFAAKAHVWDTQYTICYGIMMHLIKYAFSRHDYRFLRLLQTLIAEKEKPVLFECYADLISMSSPGLYILTPNIADIDFLR